MRSVARAILVGLVGLASCAKKDAGSNGAQPTSVAPAVSRPTESEEQPPERVSEREALVRGLERDGIRDARVLEVMRRVPRHRFVPEAVRGMAYVDRPLPIGHGQTISQPHVVALMTQAVAPKASDRCLEIGTGSGYQAAILSELCERTYSIEYVPELAAFARENLRATGYEVELRQGDGYRGWPEAAPFDVIVVTAAPERIPEPLLEQLELGGRLVIPVGPEGGAQTLELWTRTGEGKGEAAFERQSLADVRFVPFVRE